MIDFLKKLHMQEQSHPVWRYLFGQQHSLEKSCVDREEDRLLNYEAVEWLR